MDIKGTIKVIKDIQQVSDKFQKREFVILTEDQYPQTICVELQGNNVDIIDAYSVGESVIVDINLRGRLWTNPQGEDKYFNTIVAWRIQKENAQYNNTATTQTSPMEYPQANQTNSFVDVIDHDLGEPPF
jgi:single-stranded DNA-binding protein